MTGGDGKVKKLRGSDTQWSLESEVVLQGKIMSLTLAASGAFIIAGTSHGLLYKIDTESLEATGEWLCCGCGCGSFVGKALYIYIKRYIFMTMILRCFVGYCILGTIGIVILFSYEFIRF